MARFPSIGNPLSALEALARVPRRFGNLPGDEWVRDEARASNDMLRSLGFHTAVLGQPAGSGFYDQGGQELPLSVGAAPMLPWGGFGMGAGPRVTGGVGQLLKPLDAPWKHAPGEQGMYRMAPARSKGQEMRRQHILRGQREGRRGIESDIRGLKFLPEVKPEQEAFRQYLLKQGPGEEAGYDALLRDLVSQQFGSGRMRAGAKIAERDQKQMLIEELDDLLPEGSLDVFYQDLDSPVFNEILGLTSDIASRSRLGRLEGAEPPTLGGSPRGLDQVEEFLNAKQRIERNINRSVHQAADAGNFDEAARLAAQLWRYARSPREQFNSQFGRYRSELLSGKQSPEVYPTEGKAWADQTEAARKALFREMNAKRRLYRGRT